MCMFIGLKRQWARLARCFLKPEGGGVAIYVALVSAVMMGFGALVLDLGRLFTLQTELQNAADAAALAGAAELDGTTGARARARIAATTALPIDNRQTFAPGGADVTFDPTDDIHFFSALSPNDFDDPLTDTPAIGDADAYYIEVIARARQIDYLLAPALAAVPGGDGNAPLSGQASAVAVAGFNSVVCNFPPLMICNPAEALPTPSTSFTMVAGQLIQLKARGGSGHWTPGNFGLLDPPSGNQGTPAVMENIATASPLGCYSAKVDLRTGAASNPISKAFNVRFDMYENPGYGGNAKNQNKYKPAPNVTKGKYKSGNKFIDYPAAIPAEPAIGLGMPRHPCFKADTCEAEIEADILDWNHPRFQPPAEPKPDHQEAFWADYWATNHPLSDFGSLYTHDLDTNGDGIVTRIEVYEWENNTTNVPVGDTNGDGFDTDIDADVLSSSTGENGNAMNYGGSESPDVTRRLMPVAIINCIADGPMNGNTDNVPVVAFAKMFLTHAATGGSDQTIYAEMVGVLQPGIDDVILHDIIQLYR